MFNGPDIPVNVRQRMINLMYLVFVAMLALNISSDVLDGFEQVEHTLNVSLEAVGKRNERLLAQSGSYDAGTLTVLHQKTDSLCDYIESLKAEIIYLASGKRRDRTDRYNKADTEAASNILFAPVKGKQKELSDLLSAYRDYLLEHVVQGTADHDLLVGLELYMDDSFSGWNFQFLENTPAVAAITLLTGIQYTARMTEWQSILTSSDEMDAFKLVNRLFPRIHPSSRDVSYGNKFYGRISFAIPLEEAGYELYMHGKAIEKDQITLETGAPGSYSFVEEIELRGPNNFRKIFPVSVKYNVLQEPFIIFNPAMNILYRGMENEIFIYMPEIATSELHIETSAGVIRRKQNGRWGIVPPEGISDLSIEVTATIHGDPFRAAYPFRVIPLPPPSAFISILGDNLQEWRKGGLFSRQEILRLEGIEVHYENGLPDAGFDILGFELIYTDSFGNRLSLSSENHLFTDAQQNLLRNMETGRRLHISHIRVMGPDKEVKELAPLEIIIN